METVKSAPPVALTILEQLGGRRFILMTGAKDFVGSDAALTFRIPKAKNGVNRVRVTLNAMDLYDVETFAVCGSKFRVGLTQSGIYADRLQSAFTLLTGLFTNL